MTTSNSLHNRDINLQGYQMKSEELWDECVEIYENHTGRNYFYNEITEVGQKGEFGLLKKSMIMTIKYWRDPETVGGNVLWNSGAHVHLSDEAKFIFEKLEEKIEAAICCETWEELLNSFSLKHKENKMVSNRGKQYLNLEPTSPVYGIGTQTPSTKSTKIFIRCQHCGEDIQLVHRILEAGDIITCTSCSKTTVIDLFTPEDRKKLYGAPT